MSFVRKGWVGRGLVLTQLDGDWWWRDIGDIVHVCLLGSERVWVVFCVVGFVWVRCGGRLLGEILEGAIPDVWGFSRIKVFIPFRVHEIEELSLMIFGRNLVAVWSFVPSILRWRAALVCWTI